MNGAKSITICHLNKYEKGKKIMLLELLLLKSIFC